eukprot:GHVL01044996.1.p1 GENE.GHVL01044996.1~~GHVL01044996.1.p1  ORF type:complete len:103 (+),score=7.43 GHVL01044996.1:458-766(+)
MIMTNTNLFQSNLTATSTLCGNIVSYFTRSSKHKQTYLNSTVESLSATCLFRNQKSAQQQSENSIIRFTFSLDRPGLAVYPEMSVQTYIAVITVVSRSVTSR